MLGRDFSSRMEWIYPPNNGLDGLDLSAALQVGILTLPTPAIPENNIHAEGELVA